MIVRAAAVQLSPVLYSRAGTMGEVLAAIASAAAEGAQLIVFPETVVPYYPYFSFITPPAAMGAEHLRLYDEAVVVPGPETAAVSQAAKAHGVVVVLGVNERDHGTLYNAQLIFDADGTLVLKRRKITPTYHERMVWGSGDGSGLRVVDTAAGRVLGTLQPARALCVDGATRTDPLLAVPGLARRSGVRRPDRGDDPSPRTGERRVRRQRDGVAERRADRDRRDRAGDAERGARRLLHRDRLARGQTPRSAVDGSRRNDHRRFGFLADHQAQADDGFGRALRATGTLEPRDRHARNRADAPAHATRHRGEVP
jgi:hypothetical protein